MSEFKLIHGSCANQEVDAIVNAANTDLNAGGGICGAIFAKANDPELQRECWRQAPISDGEVVKTGAYKITNARSIFHAAGPDFRVTPGAYDKLFNAYYNSLRLLKENEYHTISFPLISASIFAGKEPHPVELSTSKCYEAYEQFTKENSDYDIDVTLCAFTDKEYEQASEAIKTLIKK